MRNCAICGMARPKLFLVSREEWRTIVPCDFWDEVICAFCYTVLEYNFIKENKINATNLFGRLHIGDLSRSPY